MIFLFHFSQSTWNCTQCIKDIDTICQVYASKPGADVIVEKLSGKYEIGKLYLKKNLKL